MSMLTLQPKLVHHLDFSSSMTARIDHYGSQAKLTSCLQLAIHWQRQFLAWFAFVALHTSPVESGHSPPCCTLQTQLAKLYAVVADKGKTHTAHVCLYVQFLLLPTSSSKGGNTAAE